VPPLSGGLLYLDSSALVKFVVPDPETVALTEFLSRWPEQVSSVPARAKVTRALWRRALWRAGSEKSGSTRAENVVVRIGLVSIDEEVLGRAATRLNPPELRSLSAIQLAATLPVPELGGVVSFDGRLTKTANSHGIATLAPGSEN
jgi:predicted nucleic acid-binding protein